MGKSHLGNVKIDKAYLGVEGVSAIYLGSEKVYHNITFWNKYSLKWDFKEEGESSTTRMSNQRLVRIEDMSYGGSTSNPLPYKDVYFQNSTPVGEIETFYYPTGSRTYGTNVQQVIKYASKSFDWLANQRGPDAFIETVQSVDANAFPDDGVQDGFYYIKI